MDTIRDKVIARASALGLTAYALAKQADLDPGTVKRYMSGAVSLNSRYVSLLCKILELELTVKPDAKGKVEHNLDKVPG